MEHIAILSKSWGMLDKILCGEKTIESRWYKKRNVPWGKVGRGEIIYFKESGMPVTVKAEVKDVLQFEKFTRVKTLKLLRKYYRRLGIGGDEIPKYYNMFNGKRYCILIILKKVQKITKSFNISKSGFGSQSAWICVANVNEIKL